MTGRSHVEALLDQGQTLKGVQEEIIRLRRERVQMTPFRSEAGTKEEAKSLKRFIGRMKAVRIFDGQVDLLVDEWWETVMYRLNKMPEMRKAEGGVLYQWFGNNVLAWLNTQPQFAGANLVTLGEASVERFGVVYRTGSAQ